MLHFLHLKFLPFSAFIGVIGVVTHRQALATLPALLFFFFNCMA
jgi:hypothetical protein